MEQQKLPHILLAVLSLNLEGEVVCSIPLTDLADKWCVSKQLSIGRMLDQHGIKSKRHRRIITEGALMGGLLAQAFPLP